MGRVVGAVELPLGDVTARHLQAVLEHRSTDTALEHAEWHAVRVREHESPAAAAKRIERVTRRCIADG